MSSPVFITTNKNYKKMDNNIIGFIPFVVYVLSLITYIITRDLKYLYFFLCLLILGSGLNFIEKKTFKILLGSENILGTRPICRVSSKEGHQKCSKCSINPYYGMPSGHAQIICLAATFWTLYLCSGTKKDNGISLIIIWIIVSIVCLQRYYSGCHSFFQICIGIIIGILCGFISYFIGHAIMPTKLPNPF